MKRLSRGSRYLSCVLAVAGPTLLASCVEADVRHGDEVRVDEELTGTTSSALTIPTVPLVTVENYDGTPLGQLLGTYQGDSWVFRSIPFAAPPVGSLRFAPPAKATAWSGTRNAIATPDACAQPLFLPTAGFYGSEDCLYLNVWTPKTATPTSGLPVLVFHHGGGFMFGSIDTQVGFGGVGAGWNDGDLLAPSQNAVVVSLQSRLGAFGYLADPALSADSTSQTSAEGNGTSGNYGLLDALQALKWVKRNISKFGGDPSRVTFWGHSGGASLVGQLIASPRAKDPADNKPYFSAAIMESGYYEEPTMAARYTQAEKYVEAVGCTSASDRVACLRSASTLTLARLVGPILGLFPTMLAGPLPPEVGFGLPFGPSIDGYVLPDQPRVRIAAGLHNKVPVIVGSNMEEGNMWMLLSMLNVFMGGSAPDSRPASCADFVNHATLNLGPTLGPQAAALYPCNSIVPNSPTLAYASGLTHAQYECPARRMAQALSLGQSAPVRRYWYTHRSDGSGMFQDGQGFAPWVGAAHALELPYFFGHNDKISYKLSTRERNMGTAMQKYWGAFAATGGNPNYTGGVNWPAYNRAIDNTLDLKVTGETGGSDVGIQVVNGVDTSICDFWDQNYTLDGWTLGSR